MGMHKSGKYGFAVAAACLFGAMGCNAERVALPGSQRAAEVPGESHAVREYWLTVEPVDWNVTPHSHGAPAVIHKALKFFQYSRDFASKIEGDPLLGIAGPVIEAEVGDRIVVHFRNLDDFKKAPHSLNFHGLDYSDSMDGAYSPHDPNAGANVLPGETFVYHYQASASSAGVWLYHDLSADGFRNMALGMYGAARIHAPGEPKLDREFYVFFSGFEKELTHFEQDYDTINGLSFMENTPVYAARQGERVRFNVIALGSEDHTFHLMGYRFWDGREFLDTKPIGPGEAWSVDVQADTPGDWMLLCHHADHAEGGMMATFQVSARN